MRGKGFKAPGDFSPRFSLSIANIFDILLKKIRNFPNLTIEFPPALIKIYITT
jgi:hypothetical protein